MAVITISREYGSGGDEIAARVCQVLNYRYFDKKLLIEAIGRQKLTSERIIDYHEDSYRLLSFVDRLLGYRRPRNMTTTRPGATVRPAAAESVLASLDEHRLVWLTCEAIQIAAQYGDVVIVGRGGQVILGDHADTFHVRIQAPLGDRIRYIAESEGVTPDEAGVIAQRHDRSAVEYLKRFYGTNWCDAGLYHLVINMSKWSIESAVSLIVSGMGHRLKA